MKTIEWGLLIVNYLFLGGLSAGLFIISALALFLNDPRLGRIARWAALLAPWPVALGSALLIFDLGNWHRFYLLFLRFKWHSPMSIGSWLLLLFTGIAFAYLCSWLTPAGRARLRLPAWTAVSPRMWAAVGLPLALAVAIYTGVLLGAVQARPFWNTNLVAQMFLFSAISTGCALLLVVLALGRSRPDPAEMRALCALDILLIALEFFIVLPYVIHGELSVEAVRESLDLILGGPFTVAFWLLFVGMGLLAPLALEIRELSARVHFQRGMTVLAGVLVIGGGYLLRYIFVYAGQMSAFR